MYWGEKNPDKVPVPSLDFVAAGMPVDSTVSSPQKLLGRGLRIYIWTGSLR